MFFVKLCLYLNLQVEFRVPGKQIDLNKGKNCQISDGTSVPCVDIDVSMSYDGVGVPPSIGKLISIFY